MSRKHAYSQHFLRSPRLVLELIGHSNIRKNDLVIDIGAGSGVITQALAKRCKHVIAIEPEANAFDTLNRNTASLTNVERCKQDILEYRLPSGAYKVFANIPFHLSAAIVRKLAFATTPPKSIYLIVQRQFARKISISPARFTSQLGAEIAPWYTVRIRKPLRKTDYTPPPNVDTVLIEIKPKEHVALDRSAIERYRSFVASMFTDYPLYLKNCPFANKKPSELSQEQWCVFYKKLHK